MLLFTSPSFFQRTIVFGANDVLREYLTTLKIKFKRMNFFVEMTNCMLLCSHKYCPIHTVIKVYLKYFQKKNAVDNYIRPAI